MSTQAPQLEAAVLETRILEIVRELLADVGRPQAAARVTLTSSFERDLGLASLDLVELLVRCEARLDIELPDEIAEQAETPAAWVRAILQGGQETAAKSQYRIVPPSREALPVPVSARTLVEVLREQADYDPGRIHVHLLEEGSGQGVTCGQIYEASLSVAAGLAERGLRRNDSVAILLPTGPDFFHAFFGVMLAGGIPVPIYPPERLDRIEEYTRRQLLILRNAKARFLISFQRMESLSRIMRVSLPRLVDVLTVDDLRRTRGRLPAVEPAEAAMIQYTSGSTGNPKGVLLTHANLLANIRGVGQALRVRPDDAVVSWLPLASDMGLVGCWMFSLYYGTPLTLLSPLEFLERPESWLWAIHDSRGTLSAAPNFAYELATRRIPMWTLEGIDLSCWRAAVNAGEPVLPDTVARFTERFRPFGFRPESVMPAYGLAEASVAFAISPPGRGPRLDAVRRDRFEKDGVAEPAAPGEDAVRFYSVGSPLAGHEARIANAQGMEVGERVQGRLLFKGPSRSAGYFRNPKATRQVLTEDGWMDTGDLAYRVGDDLFITGREKDLILREGRAVSPLDLEAAVAGVPGVERDGVAALGIRDPESGTERLVVVVETAAEWEQDRTRVRQRAAEVAGDVLGFAPDSIVLVPPRSLPKTANNKLRRMQARQLLAAGKLDAAPGAPWMQIARLQWENLGPLALLAWRRSRGMLRQSLALTLARSLARTAGYWFRVTGSRSGLGLVARILLRVVSHRYVLSSGELDDVGKSLVVANRSGALDPLVMAALLPGPVYFSGEESLLGLPPWAAFLLRPFVVGRAALPEDGVTVLFPDGPAGVPPLRSRFRLDVLRAARDACVQLVPVAIREHSHVYAGLPEALSPEAEPADTRERIRGLIARLYA